jgi:hypothetical protein
MIIGEDLLLMKFLILEERLYCVGDDWCYHRAAFLHLGAVKILMNDAARRTREELAT